MDILLYTKFLAVFVFVIALMMLFSWFLKKLGLAGSSVLRSPERRRLKVVETMPLDHRRRLVLVRRDDREHLLVLGPEGETVVETGIAAAGTEAEEENHHVVSFARDPRNVKI